MTTPPYTRYDYENDLAVRQFVQKRDRLRKLSLSCFFVFALSLVVPQRFFTVEMQFKYGDIPTLIALIIFIANAMLSRYIAYEMSVCPVCHMHIPTGTSRHGNRKVMGNGPLPDACPYCGTTFYDKH